MNRNLVVEPKKELRDKLYKEFDLSGASLVLADRYKKKVVLLQENVDDAALLPKFKLPAVPSQENKVHPEIKKVNFDVFCNRIFQIKRSSQGFGSSISGAAFSEIPEFLKDLDNGFDGVIENPDWSYYNSGRMVFSFVMWRVLSWLRMHESATSKINDIGFESILCKRKIWILNGKYYDEEYLNRYVGQESGLPELIYQEYDNPDSWRIDGVKKLGFRSWNNIRNQVDSYKETLLDELSPIFNLMELVDYKNLYELFKLKYVEKPTFEELLKLIWNNKTACLDTENATIADLMFSVHQYMPMIIPYWYYAIADQRLKEHFVFTVWRSYDFPIQYYDKNQLIEHSAVICGVAAFNSGSKTENHAQFVDIIKAMSENIVNKGFILTLIRSVERHDLNFAKRIVRACQHHKFKGLFVLGSLEERITFQAQQIRALNLVKALIDLGILGSKKRLAIIGGGISGVTIAVAGRLAGVEDITLIEQSDKILSKQISASHRYIHPTIFDWPYFSKSHEDTELPILSWKADFAPAVLETIRNKFLQFKVEDDDLISVLEDTRIVEIMEARKLNGKYKLMSQTQRISGLFECVISAVGFGPEKNIGQDTSMDYWQTELDTQRSKTTIMEPTFR